MPQTAVRRSDYLTLYITWKNSNEYIQGDNKIIEIINRRTILAASNFVYASVKSDIINKTVQKYVGSAPKMRVC